MSDEPNYGTEAEAVVYAAEHGFCVLGAWRGVGVFFENGPVSWYFVTPEACDHTDLHSRIMPRVLRFDPRWPGAPSIAQSARSVCARGVF